MACDCDGFDFAMVAVIAKTSSCFWVKLDGDRITGWKHRGSLIFRADMFSKQVCVVACGM